LNDERALDFAIRSLKYTGHEQRNEAREKYEEKCARNMINKALNKKRWCPKLTE
jgi:hypothetical protein